jgi:chromosome segregation ATPase
MNNIDKDKFSDVAKGAHYDNLSRDELIAKNKELRQIISELRLYQDNMEKFTSRVYAPGKSYKELEEKLEKLEQEKNKEIDRLIDTMAKANKEIQKCQTDYYNLKSKNIDLERVIEKQNVVIFMAAGYISSTPQFSNDHPINIKKWLIGGME